MSKFKACHCCGMIHRLPPLTTGEMATCVRCHTILEKPNPRGVVLQRTAAFAWGALILYWPAVLLPILRIERLGHHRESSLLVGTFELLQHGSWFVGMVVLLFSMVFPLIKILLLLELSMFEVMHHRHKAFAYRLMENAGKWSMMDVMLLAFLVMLVKLGRLVEFQVGPAVFAFVLCVALSMFASFCFDPRSIWEEDR